MLAELTPEDPMDAADDNKVAFQELPGVLRDYFNSLSQTEATEIARWDGGNDEGDVQLTEENFPSELEYWFIELLADYLDYGGFAGNFSTVGTIHYDPVACVITFAGHEVDYEQVEGVGVSSQDINLSRELNEVIFRINHIGWGIRLEEIDEDILGDKELLLSQFCDLTLNDGPIPEDHDDLIEKIYQAIRKGYASVLDYFADPYEVNDTWYDPDFDDDPRFEVDVDHFGGGLNVDPPFIRLKFNAEWCKASEVAKELSFVEVLDAYNKHKDSEDDEMDS